jgi:hypothetical protein
MGDHGHVTGHQGSAPVLCLSRRPIVPSVSLQETEVSQCLRRKGAGRWVTVQKILVELAHQWAEATTAGLFPDERCNAIRRYRQNVLCFATVHAIPPSIRDVATPGIPACNNGCTQARRIVSGDIRNTVLARFVFPEKSFIMFARPTASALRRVRCKCATGGQMPVTAGKIVSTTGTRFFRDFFRKTRQYGRKTTDGEFETMATRMLEVGAGLLRKSALALVLGTGAAMAQQTDITIGMVLEPPNLDPTGGAAAAIDEVVYANIFEGLTRFAPDGSVIPGLAESWDISEDGLTYTFMLRSGVTFHDGAAMTAEDVVFSLDRARAEDSTNAQKPLFSGIESVEAVDDTTVVVTLTAPDGAFPFKMAWGDAVIVDPASAETQRNQSRRHRTVPFLGMGAGRPGRDRPQRRLLGRTRRAGGRDLPVHLRPQRGLCGDDVGRYRRLPELPRARDPGAVRGQSAVQRRRRLDRGRNDPGDEQRGRAVE